MTRPGRARSRRIRALVAAPALTVGLAAAGLAGCGSSAKAGRPTTTTRPKATSTSPSSTAPASVPATPAPTPATTAATTPTTPPDPTGPVVSNQGAELGPPNPAPAPVALPGDCHELAQPGTTVDCGRGSGGSAGLLWVVRHGPASSAEVDIYRVSGNQATMVLTAKPSDPSSWTGVQAFAADIGGPPGAEIVVGYRLSGTGGQLHVDAVGGDGSVLFHRELDQGRVDTTGGVYRDWTAEFGPDDPNCCPSVYTASTVAFVNGQWRVGSQAQVPPAQVPKGQVP